MYVTDERALENQLDTRPCVKYTIKNTQYDIQVSYWYNQSDSGITGGQSTTSWRSKPEGASDVGSTILTGSDMYKAIRRGVDVNVPIGSSGNEWSVTDRRSTPYDNGHEFQTEKYCDLRFNPGMKINPKLRARNLDFTSTYTSGIYQYTMQYHGYAPRWLPTGMAQLPSVSFPTESQRALDGTELVKRASPVKPISEGLQTLAELKREGYPVVGRAISEKGLGSKTIGSTYLEHSFGSAPTLGFVNDALFAYQKSNKVLTQLQRDDGKPIHRRRTLYDEDETTIVDQDSVYGTSFYWRLNGGLFNVSNFIDFANAKYVVTDRVKRRCYFSGEFIYHLSSLNGLMGKIESFGQEANLLYGTTLDLDVLWELVPWSWLADYWFNVGDVLSNLSDYQQYGLVMRYGYVMHSYSVQRTCTVTGLRTKDLKPLPAVITSDMIYRKMTRMRANPFGFGVSSESLEPRQWAILGALGMTKGPELLRLAE